MAQPGGLEVSPLVGFGRQGRALRLILPRIETRFQLLHLCPLLKVWSQFQRRRELGLCRRPGSLGCQGECRVQAYLGVVWSASRGLNCRQLKRGRWLAIHWN